MTPDLRSPVTGHTLEAQRRRTDAELKLHERDLSPRPAAPVTFTEVLIGLVVLAATVWVLS